MVTFGYENIKAASRLTFRENGLLWLGHPSRTDLLQAVSVTRQ